MEAYTLDAQSRRIEVVDRYISFIWTERWTAFGDFELVVQDTPANRRIFKSDTHMVLNDSDRVMIIENIEIAQDSEGRDTLKITGRSIERILDDRACTQGLQGLLNANPTLNIEGTPGYIARFVFNMICVQGYLNPGDIIPDVIEGSMYEPTTIPESTEHLISDIPVVSVYKAIKDICDAYSLGFRLVRHAVTGQLYFDVYTGDNRTTRQSTLPPVVFSPSFDNMTNIREMTSIAQYKNVAYVFSKNGSAVVYGAGADPTTSGFDRRVLVVNATDIDDDLAGEDLNKALMKQGAEGLAVSRGTAVLDGEISQTSIYKYGRDYRLGDIVEMRNSDGVASYMRVTEQIFVSDAEGERSYPTLSAERVVVPGSWSAWESQRKWTDELTTWTDANT